MEQQVLFEIKQLQNSIVRTICNDMKKHNIASPPTLIQVKITEYLIQNQDRDIYQKELEAVFKLRRSTISGILQTMEKRNIIKRIGSQNDARTKRIILTSDALKRHKEVFEYLERLEQQLIKDIKEEELELFYQVINKMKCNIEMK